MSATVAQLQPVGEGGWSLCGPVTFDTVPRLWPQGLNLASSGAGVQVDLAQVQAIDSAGLALLLAWRAGAGNRVRRAALGVGGALLLQLLIGIFMVRFGFPLSWATAHNAGAVVLLLATLLLERRLRHG